MATTKHLARQSRSQIAKEFSPEGTKIAKTGEENLFKKVPNFVSFVSSW